MIIISRNDNKTEKLLNIKYHFTDIKITLLYIFTKRGVKMLKKQLFSLSAIVVCLTVPSWALTLQESVAEAINTNPTVNERIRNYRATQQDLDIAESEYYPQIDFSASFGVTDSGKLKNGNSKYNHTVVDQTYNSYTSSLTLTQNLFNGFGTMNKVDYEEARILAAAYNYIEKANDIAIQMTSAYLDVYRSKEAIEIAQESVAIHEDIYGKVKSLFDSGLTTESEMKKIESALALARSNLTVQINNSKDRGYTFKKVLGRMPDLSEMEKPTLNMEMPESMERANLYAINHNPSILTANYDLKGAQALKKQREKTFYPTVDLQVSQNYNDQNIPNAAFAGPSDSFIARVVLNYNLFRGGADVALSQQNISKINQEVEIRQTIKRRTIEQLELSWNAYTLVAMQLKDLRQYRVYSEATLALYKDEYDLGTRSLLDLLSAQNDVINSKNQILDAEYAQLFGKYRILDAMGLLPEAVLGDAQAITAKVNLYTGEPAHEILDVIPVKLDVDNDKIVDNEDLCDNSLLENNIMPYGCKKQKLDIDSDGDGVFDNVDECPDTPLGVVVDARGCPLDSDKDKVLDYKDKCPNTPLGYEVDEVGCAKSISLSINFDRDSANITNDLDKDIVAFALYMKSHPELYATITGHTSRTKVSKAAYNLDLSKRRAASLKERLVGLGIDESRLTTDGKGFEEPIADNSTEEGRRMNRRLEIKLTK